MERGTSRRAGGLGRARVVSRNWLRCFLHRVCWSSKERGFCRYPPYLYLCLPLVSSAWPPTISLTPPPLPQEQPPQKHEACTLFSAISSWTLCTCCLCDTLPSLLPRPLPHSFPLDIRSTNHYQHHHHTLILIANIASTTLRCRAAVSITSPNPRYTFIPPSPSPVLSCPVLLPASFDARSYPDLHLPASPTIGPIPDSAHLSFSPPPSNLNLCSRPRPWGRPSSLAGNSGRR